MAHPDAHRIARQLRDLGFSGAEWRRATGLDPSQFNRWARGGGTRGAGAAYVPQLEAILEALTRTRSTADAIEAARETPVPRRPQRVRQPILRVGPTRTITPFTRSWSAVQDQELTNQAGRGAKVDSFTIILRDGTRRDLYSGGRLTARALRDLMNDGLEAVMGQHGYGSDAGEVVAISVAYS